MPETQRMSYYHRVAVYLPFHSRRPDVAQQQSSDLSRTADLTSGRSLPGFILRDGRERCRLGRHAHARRARR